MLGDGAPLYRHPLFPEFAVPHAKKIKLGPVFPLAAKVLTDILGLVDGATPEELGQLLLDATALVEALHDAVKASKVP
jgi:hypothetical protein